MHHATWFIYKLEICTAIAATSRAPVGTYCCLFRRVSPRFRLVNPL